MEFASQLQTTLAKYDLLTHQLYQYWNEGKLTKNTLIEYAKQYYHHVESFPKCLSMILALSNDPEHRKVIIENLIEEEYNTPNHPELWLDFAKGLEVTATEVKNTDINKKTADLLNDFRNCCKASYEEGLGALYAHEWQYSKIAETKKAGLKKFYGIEWESALKFFEVHSEIDVWHSEQLTSLINKIPEEKQEIVKKGAEKAAKALWGFLDGILEYHHA
ncbi:MAG: CADD family putative folate metabolism protein [Alphaproteobacteria bacterium]